ncbi:hypothetical protein D3C75_1382800 [compost metagenome]
MGDMKPGEHKGMQHEAAAKHDDGMDMADMDHGDMTSAEHAGHMAMPMDDKSVKAGSEE